MRQTFAAQRVGREICLARSAETPGASRRRIAVLRDYTTTSSTEAHQEEIFHAPIPSSRLKSTAERMAEMEFVPVPAEVCRAAVPFSQQQARSASGRGLSGRQGSISSRSKAPFATKRFW